MHLNVAWLSRAEYFDVFPLGSGEPSYLLRDKAVLMNQTRRCHILTHAKPVANAWLVIGTLLLWSAAACAGEFQGFTEPYHEIEVASPETGIVQAIRVKQGQRVEQGQVLAVLDDKILLTALAIARAKANATAQLDAAEAEFELRQRRLLKLESLRREGHASQEEVERTRTDVQIARARVLAAQEERELAGLEVGRIEVQLERRRIVSPISGIIARLHKEAGEFVSATAPEIATVVQLDYLRVKLYLSTAAAERLAPDQTLTLLFPDTAQQSEGKVDFVSPTTDADSGTVRVEVLLDNRTGNYRSGVRVRLKS